MTNKLTTLMSSLLMLLTIGTKAQEVSENGVTATWPFSEGTSNATGATLSNESCFSATAFSVTKNLTCKGLVNPTGGTNFTMFEPVAKQSKANDDDAVVFTIIPKKGLTFTPTSISFCASKIGTSGGIVDIKATAGEQSVKVLSSFAPLRNNETPKGYSVQSSEISGVAATSDKPLIVTLYIYSLDPGKQLGLRDIVVTGNMNGTIVAVPSYTLSTSVSDAAAGTVTANPAGDKFDEGTNITLTASENLGYHFQKWVNAEGTEISNENPYTFSLSANTNLKAVYTKKNVYTLSLGLTDGAKAHLVDVTPAGEVINGVHYYEEGTQVKLLAADNAVLTFLKWEDNTTNRERSLTMSSNTEVTASYSATDYIVGWDFYYDTPNSQRAADFASSYENTGLMSLRKEDGTTSSWLAMGVAKGKQNGKYGARSWRPLKDNYYFEFSFSTTDYQNVKVAATVGDDYNAYSVVNMEYSTDGTNFSKVGTYTLPARSWTSDEFALPEAANNQAKVWVRFMPDRTSPLVGQEGTNDGFAITDIFVTAENVAAADEVAPALISVLPAEGANDASANGSIILTFDEKVIAGSGNATLGSEILKATFSGKTVVFNYAGLDYNTAYKFAMPKGYVTDRSGNEAEAVEISFTTMERTRPDARMYDAVVAQDGTGDYETIQAAIDNAPTNSIVPYLIFVKAGVYKEHIDIPANKPYIHLIGQDRELVSIEDDKLCGGDNALDVSVGATVVVRSANCYFEGVNFVNSYGRDKNNGPQALALYTMNDRVILNRCGLISYQDTWLTTKTINLRHYAKDCFIEGAVDFIYGQGNVYFDACTINIVRKSGGYIVAPNHAEGTKWGYVFMNNRITAPGVPSETSVWLGRPWHEKPITVFINTVAEVTIPAAGWYNTMGGLPALWADYNTVDGNGNPLDLSNREKNYFYVDKETNIRYEAEAKNYLTDEEAAQYTVKNVLSGDDNWQPQIMTEQCATPKVSVAESGELTWDAVDYAICYIVEKDGKVIDFVTTTEYTCDKGAKYAIYAANEFGGLSKAGTLSDNQDEQSNAIENINATRTIKAIYALDGRRQNSLQHGMNIVEFVDQNGNTTTQKVVVK